MRGLQYSTDDIIEGPWLLDTNALKDLDSIIQKHWRSLESRRNQLLDLAVDDEYKKYEKQLSISHQYVSEQLELFRRSHPVYSVSYLQICLRYKKSRYFCESFESAFRERSLFDSIPNGFAIEFNSVDIKCKIDLSEQNGMSINVVPEEVMESQELFLDIYQWTIRHRAPYWQRLWGKIADRGYWPYFAIVVVSSLVLLVINTFSANSEILALQEAAQRLIDQGLSTSNMPQAIELLLKMQILDRSTIEFPGWYTVVVFGSIILGIILHIRPKIVLGIGKGSNYLRSWKIWQVLVGVTIPTLIFYNFVLPPVVNFIKQLINIP